MPWRSSSCASSAATRAGASDGCRVRPAAVVIEREADVAPRHREALHRVEAGGIFGARRAQELAPRRDLVEQALDADRGFRAEAPPAPRPPARHGRSRSASRPRPRTRLSSVSRDTLAIDGRASPRKPKLVTWSIESPGSFEVAWRSSARRISSALIPDPSSVDFDQLEPAGRQPDRDLSRAGVERIFNQLFQGAGRPLDHLARGDAIDELGGQPSY